jgi:hypothetical protein
LVYCPGLEPGAHGGSDLFNTEVIADAVPKNPARLAAGAARSIAFLQKRQRLIGPQQLNQNARVSPGVSLRPADASKLKPVGYWVDV